MSSSSFPTGFQFQGPSLFEFKYHDQEKKFDVYRLNDSKLSEDECHIFFPVQPCEELVIVTAMEFITFHPLHPIMNDKFNISPVNCGNIALLWCRFPKEFIDVCDRASKVYGMTMKIIPRVIAMRGESGNGTALEFPKKSNILSFQGARCYDPNKITQECKDITFSGNILESVQID